MNYFLSDESILKKVEPGDFYMTESKANKLGVDVGDKLTIELNGLSREFVLADKIKDAVFMHHERMDGSGYPQHLQGNEIHYFARYVAIIDTYIAMASPRSYRNALTPLQIIGHFENSLEKYDTEILIPIIQRIGDAQIGTTVELNDGSIWEVFIIHPSKISRPVLKNAQSQILDLLDHPELEIVKNV